MSENADGDDDEDGDGDGGEGGHEQAGGGSDPYAGLDGAFGGYLADEPRPMIGGRRGEEEDLLF